MEATRVPAGALIDDEYSQDPGALRHARALRSFYGRAQTYRLDEAEYASPGHAFGDMPMLVTCGDKLQLPPAPESASVLAPTEGRSKEHQCGVQIFRQYDDVFVLTSAFRFTGNDSQRAILELMRKPGGCTLSKQQWKELLATDIQHGASLDGTDGYTHCSYAWSSVCVGQAERSKASAKKTGATLFLIPAQDSICDRIARGIRSLGLGKLALQHPNMNDMNHLPGIALLHEGMEVRVTLTLHHLDIPPDTVATIQSIDLHPDDVADGAAEPGTGLRYLKRFPRSVAIKIHDCKTCFLKPEPCTRHASTGACKSCTDCQWFEGLFLVQPVEGGAGAKPRAWQIEVQDANGDTHKIKGFRRQLPLTTVQAGTLHTMQGSTADKGLIFHWVFPKLISAEAKWLATYVAPSRTQSLALLRSINLTPKIRSIIEQGPPPGIVQRFGELFDEKLQISAKRAADLMKKYGWY